MFLSVFTSYKGEKNGSCRNFRRRHMLKMACSDGGKILLPKLMGFSGKDCTGCLGQSPALMVQGNDCSWNNRCKVDLSARRMVTGCYTNMKSVEVAEGQCIHNGEFSRWQTQWDYTTIVDSCYLLLCIFHISFWYPKVRRLSGHDCFCLSCPIPKFCLILYPC